MLKINRKVCGATLRKYFYNSCFCKLRYSDLLKATKPSCTNTLFNASRFYCHSSSLHAHTLDKEEIISRESNISLESNEDLKNALLKVWFNSVREKKFPELCYKYNAKQKYLNKAAELEKRELRQLEVDVPLALKLIQKPKHFDEVEKPDTKEITHNEELSSETVNFPYSIHSKSFETSTSEQTISEDGGSFKKGNGNDYDDERLDLLREKTKIEEMFNRWMADYEKFDDSLLDRPNGFQSKFGTPDRSIPVSVVPCGGCGAFLHCQDPGLPGYLPSELFRRHKTKELRAVTCQRCHFLKHYNMLLDVNVSPEEYPKLLSEIRYRRGFVILMVDLTDFPCSIWPGLIDIIGHSRPLFIVGNKVDLLPCDSSGYLEHIEMCLRSAVEESGFAKNNIKHVCLISARTSFGVERLITKLYNEFEYKSDVYLVGCTNVGKSTLFNALLQSDYCRVKARDLVQRATIAAWPGTTLNLLKFPIMRPIGWKMYLRMERLQSPGSGVQMENELRRLQKESPGLRINSTLQSSIGTTLESKHSCRQVDAFHLDRSEPTKQNVGPPGLDPDDPQVAQARWCYDTPGALSRDQILSMLTTEELVLTLPDEVIVPRTFAIPVGCTLFLAGMGRIDYVSGALTVMLTVFSSSALPVTVCQTEDADDVYNKLLGSEFLGVPCGKSARLEKWPGLQPHDKIFCLNGITWAESCGDFVLSSAGWVSVTARKYTQCEFRVWTPEARGIYLRQPSLLRFGVNARGKRVRRSPEYLVREPEEIPFVFSN